MSLYVDVDSVETLADFLSLAPRAGMATQINALRVIDRTMTRNTYQTASPITGSAHVICRDGSEARVSMRDGYVTKVHV